MNNSFYNYERDGITQGLLIKFMSCRQEAKLFLQGWSPKSNKIPPALMYGTLTHGVLENVYDDIRTKKRKQPPSSKDIALYVRSQSTLYKKENPNMSNEGRSLLEYSSVVAESTLPSYFRRWWKQDSTKIVWKKMEHEFKIPYKTKDGRKTYLRGKIDGVFTNPRLRGFETKTASMINEGNLMDTLNFEFQNNMYLWALVRLFKVYPSGILYNMIRKTCLKLKKGENLIDFGTRLKKDAEKRPDFYFFRYEIGVSTSEIKAFEIELEGIVVDFMDWCEGKRPTYKNTSQCVRKYGACQMLQICSSGNYAGYEKRKQVFRELEV